MAHHDDLEIPPFLDRRNGPKQTPSIVTGSTISSANLAGLIERAATRLMQAKSSAEVLEAKELAEIAIHYARVTKAANETQMDCLRIITRAEIRMANEVDAAQQRGQLKCRGGDQSKVRSADFAGAALDKRRLNEWRAVRDAGEQFVEDLLRGALAEERTPTKREIVDGAKALRQKPKGRAASPQAANREDTSSARGRARRECPRSGLIRVHWQLGASSATIAQKLLAKLARDPTHLALCAVLRTFLTEQVTR